RRTVDLRNYSIRRRDSVADIWCGRDQLQIKLPLEPLLNDLHVQQTQKPAPEAESKRRRRLRLIKKRRIVKPQLVERVAKFLVPIRLDRIEPREHHRLYPLEPRERSRSRSRRLGDRVPDFNVCHRLDRSGEEPDFACSKLIDLARLRR